MSFRSKGGQFKILFLRLGNIELDLDQLAAYLKNLNSQLGLSEQPCDMALALNIRGQKPWRHLLAAALRGALLFAVVLALGGLVVGGITATAPGSANEQQAAAVTGHPAACCGEPSQKTYHDGSGMHVTCAFCVPIQLPFKQVAPPFGSESFLQSFAATLSRSVAPEPFPPRIIPTV